MSDPSRASSGFLTTRWSVVRNAGGGDPLAARAALGELCLAYERPVLAFLRRSGHDEHDARDLAQGFFTRLIDKRDLGELDPSRGRFRAFLLAALKHFVSNERARSNALKRGGGREPLALGGSDSRGSRGADFANAGFVGAEFKAAELASAELAPERAFEHAWALAVLEHTFARLEAEHAELGKRAHYDAFKPLLEADPDAPSLAEVGLRLGLSEGAAKVALHRLRARFRECLRTEVAPTVTSAEEIEDELRDLFRALGGD